MKKGKKIIAIILFLSLIISEQAVPAGAKSKANNNYESIIKNRQITKENNNLIKSVTIEKQTLKVGEIQRLSLTLDESIISTISSVYVEYTADDAPGQTISFSWYGDKKDNTIFIDRTMSIYDPSTNWTLSSISIYYADSIIYNKEDLDRLGITSKFSTTGTDIDYKKPLVSDIKITPEEYSQMNVGNKITISCNITDDRVSGENIKATVEMTIPINSNSSIVKTYDMKYNTITKRYEYEIPITESLINGTYVVNYINAYDNTNASYEYVYYYLNVSGTNKNEDDVKPDLVGINIDGNIDQYKIELQLHDEHSGIDSNSIKALYKNATTNKTVEFAGCYNDNNIYILEVPSYNYDSGKYIFNSLTFADEAGNTTTIDRSGMSNKNLDFTLVKYEDMPQIKSVNFNKTSVTLGDSLEVLIDDTDSFDLIEKMEVNLTCDNDKFLKEKQYATYDSTRGKYVYKINITDKVPSGTWKAEANAKYCGDRQTGGCISSGINISNTGVTSREFYPSITKVVKDKKTYKPGETIKFSLIMDEKVYEINGGRIILKNIDTWDSLYIQSKSYDKNTKALVFEYTIPMDQRGGVYNVTNLELYSNDKTLYYQKNELPLSKDIRFIIDNSMPPAPKPTITELKIDKTTVKANEPLKVSAKISNLTSGQTVTFRVVPNGTSVFGWEPGDSSSIVMTLNTTNNTYEGIFIPSTYDPSGEWRVYSITFGSEQSTVVYDETLKFYVVGTTPELSTASFKSVSVDKTLYSKTEKVKVSIEIEKKLHEIENVYARFSYKGNNGAGSTGVTLKYNEVTKRYEGEMELDSWGDVTGIYSLESVRIKTKNKSSYIKEEIEINTKDLNIGNFEVK